MEGYYNQRHVAKERVCSQVGPAAFKTLSLHQLIASWQHGQNGIATCYWELIVDLVTTCATVCARRAYDKPRSWGLRRTKQASSPAEPAQWPGQGWQRVTSTSMKQM